MLTCFTVSPSPGHSAATAILAGGSPGIAQTMVTLGIDLGRMITVGDLQSGIERAEKLLGYTVTRTRDGASLN